MTSIITEKNFTDQILKSHMEINNVDYEYNEFVIQSIN